MTTQTATLTNSRKKGITTRQVVMLALLCAIAYVVMYLSKLIFQPFQVAGFLTFDLKDVIIAIGGFIFGPLSALAISVIVSVIEMVTISTTGPIGLLMNVLATAAFVCPAAYFYKKKHTLRGAILGLIIGGLGMTIVMILWNYIVTPMYMGVPREVVTGMLIPTFLPFNLIKAAMNGALTMLLYKPIITALRKAKLIAPSTGSASSRKISAGSMLLAAVVLVTSVLLGLALAGVI